MKSNPITILDRILTTSVLVFLQYDYLIPISRILSDADGETLLVFDEHVFEEVPTRICFLSNKIVSILISPYSCAACVLVLPTLSRH